LSYLLRGIEKTQKFSIDRGGVEQLLSCYRASIKSSEQMFFKEENNKRWMQPR